MGDVAFWQWAAGIGFGLVFTLIGYIFRTVPKLRADINGYKISYEREKQTTDRYEKAQDRTESAIAIGREVAKALGKLPPESRQE